MHHRIKRFGRTRLALVLTASAAGLAAGAAWHRAGAAGPAETISAAAVRAAIGQGVPVSIDMGAAQIMGWEKCNECHTYAVEAWKQSRHFQTFRDMHRSDRATEIDEKLGGSGSIKSSPMCLQCHYTSTPEGDTLVPRSGVSCESCHGAAKEWTGGSVDHAKLGDLRKAGDAGGEKALLGRCVDAGMISPANIYSVARNCFTCHTVPIEELVNKGGHKAGSEFELVKWSQGEVRHNYKGDPKNREASIERKRVMFVVGQFTDLEFGLRGLAKATDQSGTYYGAMKARVIDAFKKSHAIAKKVEIPALKAALPPFDNETLKALLGSPDEATAVAGRLSAALAKFAMENDGSGLGGVDDVLPKTTMGTAQP